MPEATGLQGVTVCTTSNRVCGAIRCCRFVVVVVVGGVVVDIVFIYNFYFHFIFKFSNMFNIHLHYVIISNCSVRFLFCL